MAEPTSSRFKVIIAGGSVVGLTTAVALEKAGIDYVLLEKREIAPHLGASVSIHPHTQRVFEQLGIWPEIRASVVPLETRQHYDENGFLFEDSAILQEISKMFMLSCIYNQVADKSRCRAQTGVASFTETEDGVEVVTDKGETIRGDVLIGADGIHSTIRTLMADHIASTDPEAAKEMRSGFVSNYHCIFATSKNAKATADGKQFLPDGAVHNVYYSGFSGVIAAGVPGLVFWFLFVKSDRTTQTPNTPRFTEQEMEATIAKYGDHAVGPGYTFKDLWESRVRANMLPLEEGVLKPKWNSGGRVVLMGDAVHKATINPGLGGNLAVEGVVHLLNELVPLVRRCEADGGRRPSKSEITAVLDTYETKQRPHANTIVTMSGYVTRYEAMETWWLRLLRRVSPWVSDKTKAGGFVGYINEGPWLNYLPNPDEEQYLNEKQ
ncbi:FAD/NAD(P)-binding domain-containing protein [Trichoderma citrinoviride]|uniref:FAD/NAD(P)-binding domain-containing protein n=1 Tax=Trichoderma citrinoviride TaxID=58853 RepID=A0A2T4B1C7_9HYPO|nr:FAD/NAD(P)-binding domain-containing protein [Trichoderma citrinoviride]PTB63038.1 FAD/NAD(P)-binding domain-containing protein [Trichoderma citrinoviride]